MNSLKGILLKIASTMAFTGMGSCIRALGEGMPTGQMLFSRSFFALIPLLILLTWRRELILAVRVTRLSAHLTRSLVGVCGVASLIIGLVHLPLADATALGFITPLLTLIMASIFLKEQVNSARWLAVSFGFLGVLVMLWPYLTLFATEISFNLLIGVIAILIAAIVSAIVSIILRGMTQTETIWSIVFYFSIVCSIAGLLTLPFGWIWPTPRQAVFLISMGLFGGIAQLFMTSSYRYADASMVAPFDYMAMIWAIIVGYMFFAEIPHTLVLAGAAIVISAGLAVIYKEHKQDEVGL